MRPAAAIALIAFVSAPLSSALADVYRSVDAQGHVLYSDTPTPGAQLVHTTGSNHVPYVASTQSAPTAAKPAPSDKDDEVTHDPKAQRAAAEAVQSDVAQTRAEQCKKAQDAYEHSVQARRIYNVGADGERNYLSDEEADQQRMNFKLQMDDLCKNAPTQAQP
jgi:hypothetical protein